MATRWIERGRSIRARAEHARSTHASIDVGLGVVESDSSIGGGLLAGALAYRLFVLLLPLVLLLVSGLGIYAGAADQSSRKVAEEAGLHGLIASHVVDTASSPARWIFFLVMIPAVLYALAKLYRAVAIVHALAWRGTARGVSISVAGIALLGIALVVDLGAVGVVGWIRNHNELGRLASLVLYFGLVGGTWLSSGREPREHLRCARCRHRAAVLARPRRPGRRDRRAAQRLRRAASSRAATT
jgi:hypothetical protein